MDQPTEPTPTPPAGPAPGVPGPTPASPPPAPSYGGPGRGSTEPGPAPGLAYATVGSRIIAFVIDAIILAVITGAVSAVLGLGFLGFYGVGPGAGGLFRLSWFGGTWLVWVLVGAAVNGAYFVYTWTRNGASPGQSFLGLEVRNAADGARLTQDQAIRRWAFLIVPVVSALPGVGFLVFLYQLFLAYTVTTDPARQGFHDKQVGSVVVRRVG